MWKLFNDILTGSDNATFEPIPCLMIAGVFTLFIMTLFMLIVTHTFKVLEYAAAYSTIMSTGGAVVVWKDKKVDKT